ncbi:MAG: DUF3365 domain-containing protein, partial [Campylobacterota bacterium]|nr:DUF3365 domain-containing protein [Campylobacterota bacterium]
MFKNSNANLLISIILFLLIFSAGHTYITISENEKIRDTILLEEAKSITSLFKSFRKTYLDTFVNNHIDVNEQTIDLIPVKTSNDITLEFAKSLDTRVILRTVSDRPRNIQNRANPKEMKIITSFKNSHSDQYIFEKDPNYIYRYYEPLYITPTCLKCHGKKEDAPKIIQENYDGAYDYKLGDLRGIISLEIDKNKLLTTIDNKNRDNLYFILIDIFLLIVTILFLYYKLKKNHDESAKELLSKNTLLQRKAKEFQDLQTALGVSEIISTTDTNGVILSVNDRFCEISGYKREELVGHTQSIVRHPDSEDKLFKKMWATIQNKQVFKCIIKNRRKDGSSYHVDSTIVPILNESGDIVEYIALRHNIDDIINHKVLLHDIIKGSKFSVLIIVKIANFEELENFYSSNIIHKLEENIFKNILKYFPKECKFEKVYRLENGEFAFIKDIIDYNNFTKEKTSCLEKFQDNVKKMKTQIDDYEFNPSILISFSTGKDDIYENAKLGLKELLQTDKYIIDANGLASKIREETQKNIDTINMIKVAIETGNILSYFQPLYNNKTEKIEKYESLVRLKNSEGKILSPFFFLESSKHGGYYNHITKVVLKNSFTILEKIEE